MTELPYGTWPSPLAPADLAAAGRRLADVRMVHGVPHWLEGRPEEGGRVALMRETEPGVLEEMSPSDWSVRTTAHEYGGASWVPTPFGPVVCRLEDQRLWLLTGGDPVPLTAEPPTPRSHRYADATAIPGADALLVVRERHDVEGEPVAELVRVALDGTGVSVVEEGADFYAAPRPSPDGSQVAFVRWNHPAMPWSLTELVVARLTDDGLTDHEVRNPEGSAAQQPVWDADGTLWWVDDRDDWLRLHHAGQPVTPTGVEAGIPPWVFGTRTYALGPTDVVASLVTAGTSGLAVIDRNGGQVTELATGLTYIEDVDRDGEVVALLAAGPDAPNAVLLHDLVTGATRVVRSSSDTRPEPGDVSVPEAVSFPSGDGTRTAHAFFFPPARAGITGPADERPPLIVMSHGGPTSNAYPVWRAAVAFWTTRGFAVVDVNYGGSTGFGRPYRQLLDGQWGVVDVEDCVAAARWLAAQGRVDGERLLIRGGSAGGFTTLLAVTADDTFAAGTSLYGVADLAVLANDTHKFEARYLDGLVAPWPDGADVYAERSPLSHPERLRTPLLVLQGDDDKVVPPNQSEAVVAALDAAGVPHAYLLFEGEGHGFRRADTIEAAYAAEYGFYARMLGLPVDSDILDTVTVTHL